MFSLIKQVFIILLSFSSFLTCIYKVSDQTKCMFLNDEPSRVRPNLIDFNPVELKYHPFMTSLDECTGSCNVLSPKICVPQEAKDINVKAFNMLTNENEAKTMTKHISCDWKFKFNSTTCNSNRKWNNKICHCEC